MMNRDTCPMLPVIENEGNEPTVVGVIGLEQGVGATFICRLLQRELKAGRYGDTERFIIVDMGEGKGKKERPVPDVLLIVTEEKGLSVEKLEYVLKIIKDRELLGAVVLNKYSDDPESREKFEKIAEGSPCLRIPFIPVEKFTELYNFIFYS